MNSLIHQSDMSNDIGETTEVSWQAPAEMTYDQWAAIGRTLNQLGRSLNWWLGDWLNHGEAKWGEMYSQALEATGLAPETLSKYKGVAARVAPEVRRANLSWTHHFAVAYAPESLRGPMLEIAERYAMHSRDLKELMRLDEGQLAELWDTYCAADEMSFATFSRTLNQIRLGSPSTAIVNGQRQRPAPRKEHEEDYLADAQEEAASAPSGYDESSIEESGENDDMPFAAHDQGHAMPEPVYLEEVFQFFDSEGLPLLHCLHNEVSWQGLTLRAGVDDKGEPCLLWEKNYEARDN